ncbi:MAG: cysteine desulfurase [Ruminiclostridium sp.]|nr:cysteine desulfurase [Ruminiclostridium sp.]
MTETTVYLDNAATTRVTDNVLSAMLPWLKEGYGNASALYSLARKSAIALNKARALCAEILGCESRNVYFTSGGTESDNTAIFGAAQAARLSGRRHFITTAFEHHAVLEPMKRLASEGFDITYLPVYDDGVVRPSDLEAAIRPETSFVSVMSANNEIGTIQPVSELAGICRERGIVFHTDAVQAVGNIPVSASDVDMLSLSGHKLHAPKGIGIFCAKDPYPMLLGGSQQGGRRAGTENIAAIVGLAEALRASAENMDAKNARLLPLRDRLISEISRIPGAKLNGCRERRLACNVNFSFPGHESETMILKLDLKGIAVSGGSACASGSLEPSHVLSAIGCSYDEARSSLRISMSDLTSEADIDAFLKALPECL